MALKEIGRMKRIIASGGGTLAARPNQSLLLRDVMCVPSSNDTYLTLNVQGNTVAKVRVVGQGGNHVPFRAQKVTQVYEESDTGLMRLCDRLGLPLAIPIAEGETLTLTRYAEAGNVVLIYDVYDGGDQKSADLNGSMCKKRRYIHYGTNGIAATATPSIIDTSAIWSGGPKWPFDGSAVPENTLFRILGIFAAPCAKGNATVNKGYTTFLQMLRNSQVLGDDDNNGYPFLGDVSVTAATADYTPIASVIGPYTGERPYQPMMLPTPWEFGPGEILLTQAVLAGAAASGLAIGEIGVGLLMEEELKG